MIGRSAGVALGVTCLLTAVTGQTTTTTSSSSTTATTTVEEVKDSFFCYKYGRVLGQPSFYLEDDLDLVESLQVGQGNTYVANINYLFEGKNFVQLGYQKIDDLDFREFSNAHGAAEVVAHRYNLLDSASRMLNPGYVQNETKESMIAFMFVEHPREDRFLSPVVLTAFNARNDPYYTFVDLVSQSLKETELFSWQVSAALGECTEMGDVEGSTIVGFASTIKEIGSNQLQSIQPIYYSTDRAFCSCLDENPAMSRDTVKIQGPPEDESFLDRLQREGNLETFVNGMIFLVCFILFLSILACLLCYFARAKPAKLQVSFDAFVYIDLAAKTEMRNANIQAQIVDVQKNGFKPKPKKKPVTTEPTNLEDVSAPAEEEQALANGQESAQPTTEKKKSTRSRPSPRGQQNIELENNPSRNLPSTSQAKKNPEGLDELEEIVDQQDSDHNETSDRFQRRKR